MRIPLPESIPILVTKDISCQLEGAITSPAAIVRGPWFPTETSRTRTLAKALFFLAVCADFVFRYMSNPSFLNLPLYARGLERTPYQCRVLQMYLLRALTRPGFVVKLAEHQRFLNYDPYRLVFAGLVFVSMVGTLLVTRLTISKLTGDRAFAFWTAFMVVLMSDLQLASPHSFILPYDVPALFFFAAGMYLAISRRVLGYYLLFPIAVLNRETICFVTIFFVVWEWVRLSQEGLVVGSRIIRIAPHVLAQAAIWLAIKAYLAKIYAHNPTDATTGGLFANQLHYNLRELLNPEQWPYLLSVCGFSLPFLYLLRKWVRCDGLLRACAVILPIFFAGMMLVGVIVEIRIFAEWIVLVVPAIALILHNRLRPVTQSG